MSAALYECTACTDHPIFRDDVSLRFHYLSSHTTAYETRTSSPSSSLNNASTLERVLLAAKDAGVTEKDVRAADGTTSTLDVVCGLVKKVCELQQQQRRVWPWRYSVRREVPNRLHG